LLVSSDAVTATTKAAIITGKESDMKSRSITHPVLRLVFASFAVLALAVPTLMLGQSSSAEQKIQTIGDQNRQALLKADVATLDKNLADDFTVIQPNGTVIDKSGLLKALSTGALKFDSLEWSEVKTRIYGNTAVMTSIWTRTGVALGIPNSGQVRNTAVLVNRGGRWRAVLFQFTSIAPPPSGAATGK
jgi:hypothetical protein